MCDFSQFLLTSDKAGGSNGTSPIGSFVAVPSTRNRFWTSCIMSAAAGAAGSPCPTPASPVSRDSLD